MIQSEITLREAIKAVSTFLPIKIIVNNCVLYNDYDSEIIVDQLEDGSLIFGEKNPPEDVVPNRLWQFDNYLVTDVTVGIVQHHHSIVSITAHYSKELEVKNNEGSCKSQENS